MRARTARRSSLSLLSPLSLLLAATAACNGDLTVNAPGRDTTGTGGGGATQPPLTFVALTAGAFHSCALTAEGRAYCWGANNYGAAGIGSKEQYVTVPTAIQGNYRFTSISAGDYDSCGLSAVGQAFCWGMNTYGEVGDGTTFDRLSPVPVLAPRFTALSVGSEHVCGIAENGAAYCWGQNEAGQLGDGTTQSRVVPVPVQGSLRFTAIAAGNVHSCGLTADGSMYCWGWNGDGEFGDGGTVSSPTPTRAAGEMHFASIAVGALWACGVSSTGAGYCWGRNREGELGDGTRENRLAPTPVAGGHEFLRIIAREGSSHSCGLTTDHHALCWGWNYGGELGDGSGIDRLAPTPVVGGFAFTSLDLGDHTCALTGAGEAYCWGENATGQLGDGTTLGRKVPTRVKQ